ncbi:MAG: ATP-binding protein, partial [Candidatus Krumholzibacteriia bacterium]
FARRHRDELFPGVPVVFCGLNGFAPALLEGFPQVTGVAEVFSARETVELARRLFPGTNRVYLLNDHLVTGQAVGRDIAAQLAPLAPAVVVEHAPALSLDEHRERLAALAPGTIVLLGVFYADRDGHHTTFEETGRLLGEASAVPVFCVLEFNLAGGVLGGKVVSGYWQGVAMARLAHRVLHGADPAHLPVVAERANRVILDHAELRRWNAAMDAVPEGTIVVNRPFSVWSAYRGRIIAVAVFVVLLVACIAVLTENIRRRHETEQSLRRSEESLAITLRSIGDAVVTTDPHGRVAGMNAQAERITAWAEAAARGRPLAEVLPVVDLDSGEPLPDPADAVLAAGRPLAAVRRGVLVTRDGREVLIEDSGAPITRADGTVLGVVLVFRDVTAKTELEERLRHSQKMEAVGQLAGGVAHDFNNMLAGIMGYAEMAREADTTPAELEEYTGHILSAATRAADLTRKLLAFSRKGKVLSTPVDAHELIREAMALLERSVDRRVELRTELAAANASVIGDPTQIQQAILNLGLNARDAMPDGGVLSVTTDVRWLDQAACDCSPFPLVPGDYLEITVRDTGTGIGAEVLPRIFEPFFTTKPLGEGTGLGLAAVRGTVEEHQGAIEVESVVGAGTVVRVLLPLSGLPAEAVLVQDEPPAPGGGTVLVIDDESVIRGVVRRMLEGLGWTVLLAEDGVQGLEIFRREREGIDVVLLDMVMPRMNGADCFRAIRALDPAARVVLASGFTADHAVSDLMGEGLAAFLKKPYRQAELLRVLARLVPASDSAG